MSLHAVRRCDECGANQGDTNHWWAVVGAPSAPSFMTSRAANRKVKMGAFRLDKCSHKCVTTAFNRWLDTGSVLKRKAKRAPWTAPTKETVDDELAALDALQDETETEEYAKLIVPSEKRETSKALARSVKLSGLGVLQEELEVEQYAKIIS